MGWKDWKTQTPKRDEFIQFRTGSEEEFKAGWCVDINNTIMVYDASDPSGDAIIPKEWKRLKDSEKDKWIKWEEQEPKAGKYIWIRDTKNLAFELAWAMGKTGNIKVVLPGDPSMSRVIEEEWQYIENEGFK